MKEGKPQETQPGQGLDDEALAQAAGGASYTITINNGQQPRSPVAIFQPAPPGDSLGHAWRAASPSPGQSGINWETDYSFAINLNPFGK